MSRIEPPAADALSTTPAGASARIRRGFPLGALFLLITVCAVLAAQIHVKNVPVRDVVFSALASTLLTMMFGMIIGLFQPRPLLGVFLGGAIGGVLGPIVGPACLAPEVNFPSMFLASLVGSILLLIFAVLMRIRD